VIILSQISQKILTRISLLGGGPPGSRCRVDKLKGSRAHDPFTPRARGPLGSSVYSESAIGKAPAWLLVII
jgi:hypothetical protein